MAKYCYKDENGKTSRPHSAEEITDFISNGSLDINSQICQVGGPWKPANEFSELTSAVVTTSSLVVEAAASSGNGFCTQCGSSLMDDGGCTNKNCSQYLKAGEQHLQQSTLPKAPLGRRIGGVLLERFIMWTIEIIGTLLSPFTFFITGIVTSLINAAYVSCRDLGAGKYSIEKKVGKLMVVDVKTGQPAKTWQAFVRNSYYSVGWLLNIIPVSLGVGLGAICFMLVLYVVDLLVVIVSPSGRRVGDLMAGTQVVPIKE